MTEQHPSQPIAVVGAGLMGAGIAETAAAAGLDVIAYEPERSALRHATERIETSTERAQTRGKLTAEERELLLARIDYTTDLGDIADATFVVEAIVEDERAKRDLFARLDASVSCRCR